MNRRIRIIAGPNGSGKTSVVTDLLKESDIDEVYINIDDIQKESRINHTINCQKFDFSPAKSDLELFAQNHGLRSKYWYIVKPAAICPNIIRKLLRIPSFTFKDVSLEENQIIFPSWFNLGEFVSYYHSSIIADYIRHCLLHNGKSFTFETVMSDSGKISFMKSAREMGFIVELHYVATESVKINLSRVAKRYSEGGHNVPKDRIIDRYSRSLDLLYDAVLNCDKSFLWDNSRGKGGQRFIGEVRSDGTFNINRELKLGEVPKWFQTYIFMKARPKS